VRYGCEPRMSYD